ncbi:MAG: SDR family oxidoreductase [Lachnospiraceae bacterium]|nr:SDR family oxidoreductase [Lachnospiraceae bacterium]
MCDDSFCKLLCNKIKERVIFNMSLDVKDKICIVTGSTDGIGLGISKELLKRGAEVYMSGRSLEKIARLKNELAGYGDKMHIETMDFSDKDAAEAYVAAIAESRGIDWLFPNAGNGFVCPFEEMTQQQWENIVNLNVYGVIATVRGAIPTMLKQGSGNVIATCSLGSFVPAPYMSAYALTKHAIHGLVQSLHYEYLSRGIHFAGIYPGSVVTAIFERNNVTMPENATLLNQAIKEIFEGLERGDAEILVCDECRSYVQQKSGK